jgi:hypothetical protein
MKLSRLSLIICLYFVLFIGITNLTPVKIMLMLFTGDSIVPGMNESYYLTADKKYIYQGNLSDTLKNSCYKEYVRLYPHNSHTLHRIQPIIWWRFWRWGEYLVREKWHQPFLKITDKELTKTEEDFGSLFSVLDGGIRHCKE